MAKMVKFSAKTENIGMFKEFLEKFKKINQSLLIEIYEDSVVAKTHTPDRGFIKRSKMPFDGFCEFEKSRDEKVIKIPFFNILRVMKNIDILPQGEITMEFHCEIAANSYICREMKFVTNSLTISNRCTELEYVTTLSEEVYERVIKSAIDGVHVELSKQILNKIYSLAESDTEETISIRVDDITKNIHFSGPMYDYRIDSLVVEDISRNIKIKKNSLQYVGDSSDLKINIYDDKVIVNSFYEGNETTSIIGVTDND